MSRTTWSIQKVLLLMRTCALALRMSRTSCFTHTLGSLYAQAPMRAMRLRNYAGKVLMCLLAHTSIRVTSIYTLYTVYAYTSECVTCLHGTAISLTHDLHHQHILYFYQTSSESPSSNSHGRAVTFLSAMHIQFAQGEVTLIFVP